MDTAKFTESIFEKIRILNETLWDYKVDKLRIKRWLDKFENEEERLHALFLLSQFMYFGSLQMRELLKVLYRDLYKYRIIENIRINNNDTTDIDFINKSFSEVLKKTRFLGVGNPSESGTHLLYFFRQENKLPKSLFINSDDIVDKGLNNEEVLHNPDIQEYVFFDDFCGTGGQAKSYSKKILSKIKKINPNIKVSYLMLFATKDGKKNICDNTLFDYVESVFELDESFQCFSDISRYFHKDAPEFIKKDFAKIFCERIGYPMMFSLGKKENKPEQYLPTYANLHKLGFSNCQLLIGFHHNTPDNTLPIFWWDEEEPDWYPIFRRYNKIYQ